MQSGVISGRLSRHRTTVVTLCAKEGIAIVRYSPFGQGEFPSPQSKRGKILSEIAKMRGRTVRQVALNFLTRNSDLFIIPNAGNMDHMKENSGGVGEWRLTDEDLATIKRIFPLADEDKPLEMI